MAHTSADGYARRAGCRVCCGVACWLALAAPAVAQTPPNVTEVRVEQDGRPVTDPEILALITTIVGRPFSMMDVRESEDHLLKTITRFDNVVVSQEPAEGGVRVIYQLVRRRPIDRVEFRGVLGLGEDQIRRELRDLYGTALPESRVMQAVERVRDFYRDRGYPSARIEPSIVDRPDMVARTLVLTIDAGARAVIGTIEWDDEGMPADERPRIRVGQPYDVIEIRKELDKYLEGLRKKGFYEASAQSGPARFEEAGVVVPVLLRRGRRVRVVWEGDPLSKADQERLVPVRSEASVDETLLEDWQLAIENDLRGRGYRDAVVDVRRSTPNDPELTITFIVRKGPPYVVSSIAFSGQQIRNDLELHQELGIKEGEPFVQAALAAGVSRIRSVYHARGFNSVAVKPEAAVVPPDNPVEATRRVRVAVVIDEGIKQVVGSIAFYGNESTSEARLLELVTMSQGAAFSQVDLNPSRENIVFDYRDRGYLDVNVPPPRTGAVLDQVNVTFLITEGPQVLVDRIVIDGNERTSRRTIERELTTLQPGKPFGEKLRLDAENRLRELGLFRRVRIDVRRHGSDNRADAVVVVSEADPSMVGGGGGLEISSRLRTRSTGVVEETLEVAPRGFFEIGRRNMGGKNRSINFFARVSAKTEDEVAANGQISSSYGINEYRVFVTYREPKLFDTPVTGLLTGIAERVIRPSYSFETREGRAEFFGAQVGNVIASLRFSIEKTNTFDVKVPPEQLPLIDRLFPDVRLSKISASLVRNTRRNEISPRDNDLDPSSGTFLSADGGFAAKAIGSEVNYVKGLAQGIWYHQVRAPLRTVFVLRGILGAAHGFVPDLPLQQPRVDSDCPFAQQAVQDLPASERFFAGGSTTNRGFSDDRLGDECTITDAGYPLGGSGEIIMNGEVRVSMARVPWGSIAGVAFVDAGNVFARAGDISLTRLRPAAGFGAHFYSRIIPVRAEVGFNLDRRQLSPGVMERGWVLHISLGPAF
jgi:outer membrane protein insertion porin family